MGLLTKDAILGVDDLPKRIISVPEWGGDVCLRTLTGAERDAFEEASVKGRGKDRGVNLANIRARLVAACMIDEAGKPVFSEADVAALGGKSGRALDRIFDVCQEMNGLRAEDVESMAKNSEAGPSAGSISS